MNICIYACIHVYIHIHMLLPSHIPRQSSLAERPFKVIKRLQGTLGEHMSTAQAQVLYARCCPLNLAPHPATEECQGGFDVGVMGLEMYKEFKSVCTCLCERVRTCVCVCECIYTYIQMNIILWTRASGLTYS